MALVLPYRAWGRRAKAAVLPRWPLAPLIFGAGFVVVLLVRFGDLLGQAALHADSVSAPVIGELLGPSQGRDVILGNFAWYQQLWFELATRWVPGHRQLWEAFPYLLALIGIALTAWSAWKVAGRWAATITGVLLLCAGAPLLDNLFQGTTHAPTSFQIAVLGAALVWMARGGVRVWFVVVVGVISAAGLADPLFVLAGLIPLMLAGAAAWPAGRRDLTAAAAAIAVIAVGLGLVLGAIMTGAGYRVYPYHPIFAQFEQLWTNTRLALQGYLLMNGGDFWGRPIAKRGAFAVLCALILVGGLVLAWRAVRAGATNWRALDVPYVVYGIFWASCATIAFGAYIGTTVPYDVFTFRYIVPGWFAVAALVPLAGSLGRWIAPAVTAGVCVLAFGAAVALARGDATTPASNWPERPLQAQLEAALKPFGVTKGYAAYWDAAPITWGTHLRLQVFPVHRCDNASPVLCRFDFHNVGSWYRPAPGRSFLIVDPTNADMVGGPDPAAGMPLRQLTVGRLQVYVYRDDIAAHIR